MTTSTSSEGDDDLDACQKNTTKNIVTILYERDHKSQVITHTIYNEHQWLCQITLDGYLPIVSLMKILCNSKYQFIYQ